jgi:hypothetical protein
MAAHMLGTHWMGLIYTSSEPGGEERKPNVVAGFKPRHSVPYLHQLQARNKEAYMILKISTCGI